MWKLIALFAIVSLGIVLAGKLWVKFCKIVFYVAAEAGTNFYCDFIFFENKLIYCKRVRDVLINHRIK